MWGMMYKVRAGDLSGAEKSKTWDALNRKSEILIDGGSFEQLRSCHLYGFLRSKLVFNFHDYVCQEESPLRDTMGPLVCSFSSIS